MSAAQRVTPLGRPVFRVGRQMRLVLAALVPGVVTASVIYGPRVPLHLAVALIAALGCEYLMTRARGTDPSVPIADGSVLVLAVLVATAIAPSASVLITVAAVGIGVVFGKHVYGGLGCNLFNPAMVGYAFVLACFPAELSNWPVPDGSSGATLLEYARTQFALGYLREEVLAAAPVGIIGARGQEIVALAFGIGGLALLATRTIHWRIPAATLSGFVIAATVAYALDPSRALGPLTHLFSGSIVLAAFFVATDPVSSPVTRRGQLLFGLGVGVLVYLVRVAGAYADGVAFAVLMMNASAPWLDGIGQPYSRRIR